MSALYRFGLPALIVLVGVAPARGQERRAEPDSVTILEMRRVPRAEADARRLRRLAPDRDVRIEGESDGVRLRSLPGGRVLRFGGDMGAMRFEMPAMRRHLDTLLGDGSRFRVHFDTLMSHGRTAFKMDFDSLLGARGIRLDSLRHGMRAFHFDGDGPAMRFRMEGPEGRVRPFEPFRMAPRVRLRHDGEGEVRIYRDGPDAPRRMERDVRVERDGEVVLERRGPARLRERMIEEGNGNVRIERDGDGRVRVYRFGADGEGAAHVPGARIEGHVIRLNRDGEVIEGGAEGVRVERDADGGLRIYVPPHTGDRARTPAPSRTRTRSRG